MGEGVSELAELGDRDDVREPDAGVSSSDGERFR